MLNTARSLWSGRDRGGDPEWKKGVKSSVGGGAGQASLEPSQPQRSCKGVCVKARWLQRRWQTRNGCGEWRRKYMWRKGGKRGPQHQRNLEGGGTVGRQADRGLARQV